MSPVVGSVAPDRLLRRGRRGIGAGPNAAVARAGRRRVGLLRIHIAAVHKLLLPVDHYLLAPLHCASIAQDGIGADREVHMHWHGIGMILRPGLPARSAVCALAGATFPRRPTARDAAIRVGRGCVCVVARLVLALLRWRGARVDDKDEVALGAALNRGGRHHDGIGPLVQDQPHIDELVGEKAAVGVIKHRFQFGRAGCCIDLVVDGQQGARGNLMRVVAVIRFHNQLPPPFHRLLHLRKLILRKREDDGNGVNLCDHDQAGRVGGVNDVAGIDLPQSHNTVDRRINARISEVHLGCFDCSLVGLNGARSLAFVGNL